ncbi:hypothetical protein RM780_13250 [Streptomyces sp. DSM 44917]|uniref:Uncharacterized protein n=1 Tax=Streptomyces boetiae TaxID=3075541 RepID=A0ABU2L8M4_9ACTN|nr:hypothetical protein [Streptomyces sp. DSM 44917]MDT0307923.1 hypothetical protein [Streptomyces sp. DSM 44917]
MTGVEDLRAALALLAPAALPTFDAERAVALRHAHEQVSAAPVRRFVGQWAVFVAIERQPGRAVRLRTLEVRAAETSDLTEARAIAAEIGGIIDAAVAEASIGRGQIAWGVAGNSGAGGARHHAGRPDSR